MSNTILTIAIPTYNRPALIKEQVKKLIPQLNDDVVVLILDNHSDIPVENLFSYEELERVNVVRNKSNIGADANIAKCFDLCQTDWLWTLSDDDVIESDAVESVLFEIHSNADSLFIGFNNEKRTLAFGIDEFCGSYENYQRLFWMSVCIYNVALFGPYMQYYHYSISCMQPGVVLLVKALCDNKNNSVVFSDKVLISEGCANISWDRDNFFYATLFLTTIFDIAINIFNSPIL